MKRSLKSRLLAALFATALLLCVFPCAGRAQIKVGRSTPTADLPEAASVHLNEQLNQTERRLDLIESKVNDASISSGIDASRFGVFATLLGTLTTAVVIFFTLRTSDSAVKEARSEVRAQMETWLDRYRAEFDNMLGDAKNISQEIARTEAAARSHLDEITATHVEVDTKTAEVMKIIETVENHNFPLSDSAPPLALAPKQREALQMAARDAAGEAIPNFQDLYVQGLAEFEAGNFDLAIDFFTRAENIAPDLSSRARVLNSLALAHARTDNLEEARRVWGQVESTYMPLARQHPELSTEVAKAIGNISIYLGRERKFDQSIEACDKIISNFSDSGSPEVQRQVARAYANKGASFARSHLEIQAADAYRKAISIYNECGIAKEDDLAHVELGLISSLHESGNSDEYIIALEGYIEIYRGSTDQSVKKFVEAASRRIGKLSPND